MDSLAILLSSSPLPIAAANCCTKRTTRDANLPLIGALITVIIMRIKLRSSKSDQSSRKRHNAATCCAPAAAAALCVAHERLVRVSNGRSNGIVYVALRSPDEAGSIRTNEQARTSLPVGRSATVGLRARAIMIQKVPRILSDAIRIGSDRSGAISQRERERPKAQPNARSLR